MGYFLALVSSICFGITNCLWIFPQKKQNYIHVIIFRSILTASLFGISALLFESKNNFQFTDVIIAISISVLSCLGLFFYTKSLKYTTIAIAVPVSAISSFFGVLVGLVIFKEKLPEAFFFVAAAIIVGLFLIEVKSNFKLLPLTKGIIYNLFAAIFWGITFGLFKIPIEKLGAWRFSFVLETTVLCFSLLLAFTTFKNERFKKEIIYENLKWYLPLGFLAFIAVATYNFSLEFIDVSIAALLGNLTPVVSIILSIVLFKQKINKKEFIGIAILVFAIFILNFFL